VVSPGINALSGTSHFELWGVFEFCTAGLGDEAFNEVVRERGDEMRSAAVVYAAAQNL